MLSLLMNNYLISYIGKTCISTTMINKVLDGSVTIVNCMSSLYSYFNNNYSKYISMIKFISQLHVWTNLTLKMQQPCSSLSCFVSISLHELFSHCFNNFTCTYVAKLELYLTFTGTTDKNCCTGLTS